MEKTLDLVLEFYRGRAASDPFNHSLAGEEYLLRRPSSGAVSAKFPLDTHVDEDLAALESTLFAPAAAKRLGDELRRFLWNLDWQSREEAIISTLDAGGEVNLTICSDAAELLRLPWELVTLRDRDLAIGSLPECHVRYMWSGTRTRPSPPSMPRDDGRLIFAWSGAAAVVPWVEQGRALEALCMEHQHPFDAEKDVLANVSLPALVRSLRTARQACLLHLLCHGARVSATPGTEPAHGLAFNSPYDSFEREIVDSAALQRNLSPHAGTINMVVLCACRGADPGPEGNHLGSVALTLHRAGIPAVIAARFLLSTEGANLLTRELYGALFKGQPIHRALGVARRKLAESSRNMDWAGLQLYMRPEDRDLYPLALRQPGTEARHQGPDDLPGQVEDLERSAFAQAQLPRIPVGELSHGERHDLRQALVALRLSREVIAAVLEGSGLTPDTEAPVDSLWDDCLRRFANDNKDFGPVLAKLTRRGLYSPKLAAAVGRFSLMKTGRLP